MLRAMAPMVSTAVAVVRPHLRRRRPDVPVWTTGLWTSCWMFFVVLVTVCLVWMHLVIQRMMKSEAPEIQRRIE